MFNRLMIENNTGVEKKLHRQSKRGSQKGEQEAEGKL